ncbi:ATP-dependent DNA helicase [Steroidobacter sp. S1-65]|uniref:DNA 5'-3' helicase n=1 Tax=Steroidobacter gossypii TaxID=2805490 RepID=A0ABS1WVN7_9GAMM|nr:ATP-dependent DNA helicase [Steroidobacter gossypii]MBM0105046.1 ATP-dependent DNA helicase [Steroidobacter gossypii]
MQDFEEIFGADGPLATAIPGFATRDEQIAMAEHVWQALRQQGRLIVEAGTGTGKTFAYLVPALLSGRRVIVSTGTRNLQDQLFHRDLPTVSAAIGRPVQVALLKGRANYLCLHRLDLAEHQAADRGLRREVAAALSRVRAWANVTKGGDISELAQLGESDPVWPWVTSTRDNCLGPDCPVFDRCHVVNARRKAQGADIVVVNHHLLMADLVLKEEGFGDLLPGADAIIIDEAHQLPEVAANFLGFTVSSRQLQSLAKDLASELMLSGPQQSVSAAFSQTIERQIVDLQDSLGARRERCEFKDWPSLTFEALANLRHSLDDLTQSLTEAAKDSTGLANLRRRSVELANRLDSMMEEESESSVPSVRWAQSTSRGAGQGVSFHLVPLDVAEQLGSLVQAHSAAWVCTSATLAIGESFDHFMQRVGMRDARTARFGSPFDYESQTLMYLPKALPPPSSPRHTASVIDAAIPVLKASGGRAFLLFTSHRALREAADLLLARLGPALPFPVLVQGDAPREVLLTKFRERGNAVLLGTSSFWEGVDVKGAALSVVIIDKLPFAAPDDPVLKARLEAIERRGGNAFFEEQIPQAVITLKQGVGRLMRDPNDFGVIMLCDERVRSKGYGRIFLDSLPSMPRTENLVDVQQFLYERLSAIGLAPDPDAMNPAAAFDW